MIYRRDGVTYKILDFTGVMQHTVSMDIAILLAKNVRFLRTQRGLSQYELARISGVSRPTIATLELGQLGGGIKVSTLHNLARGLHTTIPELFRRNLARENQTV